MDGGAERRVAPSAGGGGSSGLDKTLNNRIMVRFRPIAPKPIAGGPVLDNRSTMLLSGKRPKRKYVRVGRNSRRCRHTINSCEELQKQERSENAVVTRELWMENTKLGEGSVAGFSGCKSVKLDPTAGKMEIHDNQMKLDFGEPIHRPVPVVDTWVTVESMTGTCMMDLGRTDDEKVVNLARDTCPAFISDGLNRLRCVNEAYKKMVVWQEEAEEPSPEITVWLKIEDMEVYSQTAFSCKVKLQYRRENNGKCTKVVPCDAWKMEAGGFAWRLDVKAALSLGL
ncbi:hypothetical protein K1719_007819 [Acacia pycnantha]|nr:hypothetical protein K1719_007819 [Acacia pycnantha]